MLSCSRANILQKTNVTELRTKQPENLFLKDQKSETRTVLFELNRLTKTYQLGSI